MNYQESTYSDLPVTETDCLTLPEDVYVAMRALPSRQESSRKQEAYRELERSTGRALLEELAIRELGGRRFQIRSSGSEKPTANLDGKPVYINLSHAEQRIAGVLSGVREVGIDLESTGRAVSDRLRDRITHPDERELLKQHPTLRIWTIKEAALKWCGSGLRMAMKQVRVLELDGQSVRVRLENGVRAELCSFQKDGYWVSIAWTPGSTADSDR